MTQPPPPPPLSPPPTTSAASQGVQVRCAGCRMILTVAPGVTEFACPSCKLPQMLPPQLMMRNPQQPQPPPLPQPPPQLLKPAHGIDPTKIQLPCAHCKAILNVPHGLTRFKCPQCDTDLAVDLSKLKNLLPPPPPPPPEEVNEVYIYNLHLHCIPIFSICPLPASSMFALTLRRPPFQLFVVPALP